MKRRRRSGLVGGGKDGGKEKGNEGENSTNHNSSRGNDHKKRKTKKDPHHPPPPVIGTVATRTRRHKRDIAIKWKHPISILINIMRYADFETIRMLCCVSKQFYDLIYNDPRMEHNRAVPLLCIRPSEKQENTGRIERLFRFLYRNGDNLQRFSTLKIIDGHTFRSDPSDDTFRILIRNELRLDGVKSLEVSVPETDYHEDDDYMHRYYGSLFYALAPILPNLRELDLSGCNYIDLGKFTILCPHLEHIKQNNMIHNKFHLSINGNEIRNAFKLKEIIMDNSAFDGGCRQRLADLENDRYKHIFLFHKCRSTVLERVSIRNAIFKYDDDKLLDEMEKQGNFVYDSGYFGFEKTVFVPQNALIKFVRNAPSSLKWFRSNLSQENMDMLRFERPGIEFLN